MHSRSHKLIVSIGVTIGLLLLLWLTGASLAATSESGIAASTNVGQPQAPRLPFSVGGFTFQGRLTEGGVPVTGNYDFIVDLYDDPAAGTNQGNCVDVGGASLTNRPVQDGLFTFSLICGSSNSAMFTGASRWLQVQARRTGTTTYTTLPRQLISPAPYAFSLYPGSSMAGSAASALFGDSVFNIQNTSSNYSALYAKSASGSATIGESLNGNGIYGYTHNSYGVYGRDEGTDPGRGYGGYFVSTNGVGVFARSDASSYTSNALTPAVDARSKNGVGVLGINEESSSWGAGVMGVANGNPAGVFVSNGDNPIEGRSGSIYSNSLVFRVTNAGDVYADRAYHCGLGTCMYNSEPADLAEVLPTSGQPEPGDVLAVNENGHLVRATQPYQTTVMGIYSTNPAFVGNSQNLNQEGFAPLAVVGVVPVKASAENGAIHPGDLLTSSSTPGHAMKAGPNPPVGTIIGKALGSLKDGSGSIQMLVTLQ